LTSDPDAKIRRSRAAATLLTELSGSFSHIWVSVWHRYLASKLASFAYDYIDFETGLIKANFLHLDRVSARTVIVPPDSTAIEGCTQLLLNSKALLDSVLARKGVKRQTKPKLEIMLRDEGVVDSLLHGPQVDAVLGKVKMAMVWRDLADQIARDIYKREKGGVREPEWLLWNRLLLTRFFHNTSLQTAADIQAQLRSLSGGIHGPRSGLLAITEVVNEDGVAESRTPLTLTGVTLVLNLQCAAMSDLLAAIQSEAEEMSSGNGLVHRYSEPDAPGAIPARLAHVLSQEQLITFRKEFLQQHEANLLGYAALAGVEQILRSLAKKLGFDHIRDDIPRPVSRWLRLLDLGEELTSRLEVLYSSEGLNLRNRAMHAALFELGPRRLEIIRAKTMAKTPRSAYLSKNLLQIILNDLRELDAFAASAGLEKADFTWSQRIQLTPAELAFARQVCCDFLDPEDGLEWQRQFKQIFSKTLTSFHIPAIVVLSGWQKRFEPHTSILSFLIWGTMFEALFRLTVHLIGAEVLQRMPRGTVEWKFQYRMLEFQEGNLCPPDVLSHLLSVLLPEERDAGETSLRLAIKVRNAMSHGAIDHHSQDTNRGAGHIMIKAMQLLMEVIKRHSTSEAAYFRSMATPGNELRDWLSAENETYLALF
jgi:hypothetical protein